MPRAIGICVVVIVLMAAGRASAQGTSNIEVMLGGYGDVALDGTTYRCTNADFASGACPELTAPIGSTLTFTAAPAPVAGPETTDPAPDPAVFPSSFVGWSRPECEGAVPSCTFTVDDDPEAIVAHFSPVWLEVLVAGEGTVAANGETSSCTTGRCIMGPFVAGTRVDVTATPDPVWGFGCDPFDSDLLAGHCVIEMSNIRNFVSVGFQEFEPDTAPPYNLSKPVTVKRAGSGEGRVTGKGTDAGGVDWSIDCGSDCKLKGIQYQTRVRLRADEASGSTFERWSGPPCGGQTVCTFTAGKYPTVRATFSRHASASAASLPSSSTLGSQSRSEPPFDASLVRAAARGRRAKRKIVVTLTTNRSARATLRLTRKGRRVTGRSFALPAGTHTIRVKVPRRARAGWYRMSLAVTAVDGTRESFAKRLRLRR